jgi:cytochrome b561
MPSPTHLSRLTILLHWLVAAGVLSLAGVGLYMVRAQAWPLYDIHKSIGLVVFVAILARVAWTWRNGLPEPVRALTRREHAAASTVHGLLLACTVALPVTGMLFSGASGHGFGVFGVALFPEHPAPAGHGQVIPVAPRLADWGQAAHHVIGYVLLALVALHVAAALKHHVVDRDRTLVRMLGRQR